MEERDNNRRHFDRGERAAGNGRYIVFGKARVCEFLALRLDTEARQEAYRQASHASCQTNLAKCMKITSERGELRKRCRYIETVVGVLNAGTGEITLCTVTFCANPAHNLTCAPSYISI